jgi:hypothetical protein
VSLGAGGVGWFAHAAGSAPGSSVSISPCRLFDTRPAPRTVGTRATALGPNDTMTVQVTGSNGNCVIPATATAIVINITAVGATSSGFITLYPADVALPLTSNLNTIAGHPPTPNLVSVALSNGGAIKVFNSVGLVNVIGDISGYYEQAAATGQARIASANPGHVVSAVDLRPGTFADVGINISETIGPTGYP